MFSNHNCPRKGDVCRERQQHDAFFLRQIVDEESRVNNLKDQEIMATSENPRIKMQDETRNLCKELRDCKTQEILEQKRRQQLRTNSHELRQLQSQLQTALVSKQLREQTTYLAQQREEELRKKREEDKKWAEECERSKNAMLQREKEERLKKAQFRGMLQEQMSVLQQRRRVEFEDVINDRDEMKKMLKRIQDEEKAEREQAERKREICKREMEESQHNRELQRQREKEQNVDDTERHLAYQRERDEIKTKIDAERKRRQLEKEAVSEKIGQQLAAVNIEKEKRETLLLSLMVEERKAKEDKRYRQTLEKRSHERKQLRMELENYRNEIKRQKEQQLLEEERQLREEHMRYLAERDKLEQLSDEKRRRKVIEHRKALEEMIEIRRKQRVAEIVERIADFEYMISNEKERDKLVEEERIHMLRTVPGELLRYLPAGILRPSDKEFLPLL